MSLENNPTKVIRLTEPNLSNSTSLMQALEHRHSVREYAPVPVSINDLSNILWAANGVNRPDGHHTSATALNKKDIDIYVLLPEGTYIYDPQKSILTLIAEGDSRKLMRGWQEDFPIAPAFILMVSFPERFGVPDRRQSEIMGGVDAGIVSQNIMLYCAANGLVTVPRYSMDREALAKLLNLPADSYPMMNNPIGYPVK